VRSIANGNRALFSWLALWLPLRGARNSGAQPATCQRPTDESSLILFFLRPLRRLQQIATAPAIDYVENSIVLIGDDENPIAA
jgi:hypothetical protein